MKIIKTPYLVLFVILGAVGVGTASAIATITIAGDLFVTGDAELEGKLIDANDDAGTSGQVLSSTETGIDWIDATGMQGATGATGMTGMTGPAGSGLSCENQVTIKQSIAGFELSLECIDHDGDNIPFSEDNCPAIANADQTDTDSDGLGDVCDPNPNSPQNNDCSNLTAGADLSACDLSGTNLNGLDLNGVNLAGSNLIGASLIGTNLELANLDSAKLSDCNSACVSTTNVADLTNANLTDASLLSVKGEFAIFASSDMGGIDITGANFRGADLSNVDFRLGNYLCQQIARTNCTPGEKPLFADAKLTGANMENFLFDQVDMSGADFTGVNLQFATFRGGDTAIHLDASSVNFTGADFTGVEFTSPFGGLINLHESIFTDIINAPIGTHNCFGTVIDAPFTCTS